MPREPFRTKLIRGTLLSVLGALVPGILCLLARLPMGSYDEETVFWSWDWAIGALILTCVTLPLAAVHAVVLELNGWRLPVISLLAISLWTAFVLLFIEMFLFPLVLFIAFDSVSGGVFLIQYTGLLGSAVVGYAVTRKQRW